MSLAERERQEKNLEKAIDLIEQLESQVDIFTLNKAIATILERRARSKLELQNWLCAKFQDVEEVSTGDNIHPLLPDLS